MVQVPLRGTGQDGRYDHTKPAEQLPSWSYNRPWQSNEERLTTQAVAMALASAPEVQDTVRPPLPQVNLFPPRFGYRSRVLGIGDVVDVDELFKAPPNSAGTEAGYTGASRNAMGSGSW